MNILTDFELGYLAGFIDGEGALIINKRKHIDYKGRKYVGYSAYLDIGNTNRECLEWIKSKLNITSNIYENQCKGNRKKAYRLRIGYKQAKPLIEQLKSKLIVKRNIAEVFLNYETTDDKENLWNIARQLNKRGIF